MSGIQLLGWDVRVDTLIVGALTGLAYAILAAGLVLVYRATRVINFAHGEIGAFGAAVLAWLVIDQNWNFFLALTAVLALGGAIGAAIELGVVRRLFRAPRLILLVATIGVSQLMFVGQLLLPGVDRPARYPSPLPWTARVGSLLLGSAHFMVIVCVPAVIAAVAFLLTRTRYGIAIRASAENADRAELVGISTKRVSTLVWVLAGVLSTLTAVLVNPLRGTIVGLPSQALGPGLLLRALTAALVGGMVSLPWALVGGIAVGIVEAVMFSNVGEPGVVDGVLFVAVLVLVLVRRAGSGDEEAGSWSLTPRVRPISARLAGLWWPRRLGPILGAAAFVVAAGLPLVFPSSAQSFLFARVAIYGIVALSVCVLTGWAGQLSLGQFAFVGLGSMVTGALMARGMPFGFAILDATIVGVVAALLVGFPALRVRGLFLAVTTLAFAVAAHGYLFPLHVLQGDSTVVVVQRAKLWGIDLHAQRTYYELCLFVLALTALGVWKLRASGIGRSIIAVRDNEEAASSFTLAPATAKLLAFGLAGGLAALAGGLLAGLRVRFGVEAFPPDESLRVVAMTVIGGLGSVAGALLGAVYVIGLPALFDNNATVGLLTSGVGLLVLLLYLPGGLAAVAFRLRDAVLSVAERRLAPAPPLPVVVPARPTVVARTRTDGVAALRVDEVSVHFGGRVALDRVSVEARTGEIVGLIGSNGAGKSTLLNVIGGYQRAEGRVEVFGDDVSALPPHQRAALGIGRVFQDARLFSDLTVTEAVQIALEAHEPTELVPSLLGLGPSRRAERRKAAEAAEYVAFLGLGRYAGSFLSELSTGTRRIVELCCLIAQGSDLLLLDEPTAGVAQKETEAFGPLLLSVKDELAATVVIIEHDIPLVMSISDRVYCLAAGEVIAHGVPHDVRHDPRVVAAYLGTDERAIQRSGTVTPDPAGLERMTRVQLLALAGERDISGRSRMAKPALIAALTGARP